MLDVRKWALFIEEIHSEMGRGDGRPPLKKAAVCAVIRNPYAGRFVEDLRDLVAASKDLGEKIDIPLAWPSMRSRARTG